MSSRQGISAGGVNVPFGADLTQMERDLTRAKQMVKDAGAQMALDGKIKLSAGQGSTTVAGVSDLGREKALAQRAKNVQGEVNDMVRKTARWAENDAKHAEALAKFREQTGSDYITPRQAANQGRQQWLTAQAAFEQEGMAHAEARAESKHEDEHKWAIAQAAFEQEGMAHAEARAAAKTLAIRGLKIGGGAALAVLDSFARSNVAGRRASTDAAERYAFQGRTAYNDPVIAAAAGTKGMVAGSQAGALGFGMQYIPIAGAHLSEALERAARSADHLAESHQRAVLSAQDSDIRIAQLTGNPKGAFAQEKMIAMKSALGEWQKANRNVKDIEGETGTPGGQFLDFFDVFGPSGTSRKGDRARRLSAAQKVSGEAKAAYDKKATEMGLEGDIVAKQFDARIALESADVAREKLKGFELQATFRGSSRGALAAEMAQQLIADKAEKKMALAQPGLNDEEKQLIEARFGARAANRKLEGRERLRQLIENPAEASVVSASEAAGPFLDRTYNMADETRQFFEMVEGLLTRVVEKLGLN